MYINEKTNIYIYIYAYVYVYTCIGSHSNWTVVASGRQVKVQRKLGMTGNAAWCVAVASLAGRMCRATRGPDAPI